MELNRASRSGPSCTWSNDLQQECQGYSILSILMPFSWKLENWICTCQRINLDPYLLPCTKLNSKWIKCQNIRPETVKVLEINIGENFMTCCIWQWFLGCHTKSIGSKSKNMKQIGHQPQNFCTAMGISQ